MKAIIVGGGIGGLATALMLHERGIGCEVYEQADAIRELGVGINTLPHAIAELKRLGPLERLAAARGGGRRRARPPRAPRPRRDPNLRAVLSEPPRPGDRARAARARRRLRG